MTDNRKVLRLDFAAGSWRVRSYAVAPKKIVPRIDLSPRIELSLTVDTEADAEVPEPTDNQEPRTGN